MARAEFNLDKFRSQIFRQSLARNNRFEVFIIPPPSLERYGPVVSLLVEQASLPMLNVATKPFKIFGPSYQRPYTTEYGGEGIALTFHVDRDMRVKRFFDDWVHAIVNPVNFTTSYQSSYIGTIQVHQLDEQDNITYAVRIKEAFPRNLNLMDLNNAASNQTHRLNVLFAYRYWERLDGGVNPQGVPRAIATPQIPRNDEISALISKTNVSDYFNTSELPPEI